LGQAKQLLRYRTGTLIQNAINHAKSIAPVEIIVVTGAHANEVQAAAQDTPVRWVRNPRWADGLGGSIATGAEHISSDSSAVLILLCDQWRIQDEDLQALVSTWHSAPQRIVTALAGGCYVPPVIFPSTCFSQLRALKGDRGARSLLHSHPGLVTAVPLENAGFDLDSAAHLDLLNSHNL
jgi:CTP:molybdopterin cytidylyltransferase MocA